MEASLTTGNMVIYSGIEQDFDSRDDEDKFGSSRGRRSVQM